MMRFEVTGAETLRSAFKALPEAVSASIIAAALIEAAEPIRAGGASHAPRGDKAPHLADHIVIGKAERETDGSWSVPIGPEHHPQDFFYGYFQEKGTVFHPPHPFMRPAFDEGIGRSIEILAGALWQAISRRVGGGGRFL